MEQKICLTTSAPLHSWNSSSKLKKQRPDFWDLTSISTVYPSPWQTAFLLSKVASKAVGEGKSQLQRELTFPPGLNSLPTGSPFLLSFLLASQLTFWSSGQRRLQMAITWLWGDWQPVTNANRFPSTQIVIMWPWGWWCNILQYPEVLYGL